MSRSPWAPSTSGEGGLEETDGLLLGKEAWRKPMAAVTVRDRGTCLEELCGLGMGSNLKDGLQAVAHGRCPTEQVPRTWLD